MKFVRHVQRDVQIAETAHVARLRPTLTSKHNTEDGKANEVFVALTPPAVASAAGVVSPAAPPAALGAGAPAPDSLCHATNRRTERLARIGTHAASGNSALRKTVGCDRCPYRSKLGRIMLWARGLSNARIAARP